MWVLLAFRGDYFFNVCEKKSYAHKYNFFFRNTTKDMKKKNRDNILIILNFLR